MFVQISRFILFTMLSFVLGMSSLALAKPQPPSSPNQSTEVPLKKKQKTIIQGKIQAPIEIDGAMKLDDGYVDLKFLTSAQNVKLTLQGLDGLQLIAAHPTIDEEDFSAGDEIRINVDFIPSSGLCYLSITVEGVFNGRAMHKTSALAVGTMNSNQKRQREHHIKDSNGKPLHIMPAQEKRSP